MIDRVNLMEEMRDEHQHPNIDSGFIGFNGTVISIFS
jgi:hypothetical protein